MINIEYVLFQEDPSQHLEFFAPGSVTGFTDNVLNVLEDTVADYVRDQYTLNKETKLQISIHEVLNVRSLKLIPDV